MTMHTAKGLEFPVVFIVGCEQDLIPYRRPGQGTVDSAEERGLFYVAMTRAGQQLYLTCAKKRRIYGRLEKRRLSSFVAEIEDRLKQTETSRRKKKGSDAVQLKLF
jgi:DNA helicase-2/ATP-dependent DNA helicase PcrA